jgi:hypothetical protein
MFGSVFGLTNFQPDIFVLKITNNHNAQIANHGQNLTSYQAELADTVNFSKLFDNLIGKSIVIQPVFP